MATKTFDSAGSYSWVVPDGVTTIDIEALGGQGGGGSGSQGNKSGGGRATGTLVVTPGETLDIYVGGAGSFFKSGGFNGGGTGGEGTADSGTRYGGGGGGATDVRQGGALLADRKIVAGGSGGAGGAWNGETGGKSGTGGGTSGGDGGNGSTGTPGGDGGTQTGGGAGNDDGVLLEGGSNGDTIYNVAGGGGGGGYYGGGSGYHGGDAAGAGAGGSGYIGGVSSGSLENNYSFASGDGEVTLIYILPSPTVISPNGGEVWDAQHDITWSDGDLVDIELSTDDGGSWDRLATNHSGTSFTYDFSGEPSTTSARVRVRNKDNDGNASAWDYSDANFTIQHNVAPNAPALDNPVGGATIDRTVTNRFSWTFSDPDSGDSQSKYQLQARVQGTTTWTYDVTVTTSATYRDIAGGTFAAGEWEWRVRTWDAAGEVGPYSAATPFVAATGVAFLGSERVLDFRLGADPVEGLR